MKVVASSANIGSQYVGNVPTKDTKQAFLVPRRQKKKKTAAITAADYILK